MYSNLYIIILEYIYIIQTSQSRFRDWRNIFKFIYYYLETKIYFIDWSILIE